MWPKSSAASAVARAVVKKHMILWFGVVAACSSMTPLELRELVLERHRRRRLTHLKVRRARILLPDAVHVHVLRVKRREGDGLDALRHRGGEEKGLSLPRDVLQNLLNRRLESHVQQTVRLVQHQRVTSRQPTRQVFVLQVIQETPGGGHEYVAPIRSKPRQIAADIRAAAHHLRAHALVKREQLRRLLVDLRGELARGREHENGDGVAVAIAVADQFLERGEEERDGLSGTGLGAREHVDAADDGGEGGVLDGGGVRETLHLGERAERLGAEVEVGERDGGRGVARVGRGARGDVARGGAGKRRERMGSRRGTAEAGERGGASERERAGRDGRTRADRSDRRGAAPRVVTRDECAEREERSADAHPGGGRGIHDAT